VQVPGSYLSPEGKQNLFSRKNSGGVESHTSLVVFYSTNSSLKHGSKKHDHGKNVILQLA
jgi:hypothetical protein